MSDYIGWYTVELRSRLAGSMPTAKVESIVREANGHLNETCERLQLELGLDKDAAALAAVEAFGSPEAVTLAHLHQLPVKILGLRPVWAAILFSIVAILCWDYHWLSLSGPFDNYGATWINGLCGIIGFTALFGLVVAIAKSKRTFRSAIAATVVSSCVLLPLLASYLAVPSSNGGYEGVLRPSLKTASRTIPESLAKLDRLQDYIKQGSALYATAKTPESLTPQFRNLQTAEILLGIPPRTSYPAMRADGSDVEEPFPSPQAFVYAPARGGLYALRGAASFAEAKKFWAESDKALEGVARARTDLLIAGRNVDRAMTGQMFFFNPRLMVEIFSMTAVFSLALFLVDGVASAIARRRRHGPRFSIA